MEDLVFTYQQELKPEGEIYLFIDEIHRITGWEHLINSYSQNYTSSYEIFISGSNSQLLSAELASLLSGRYIQFQIFPFSYLEFISIKKTGNSKESFLTYLQSGGLPELFHLPNDEIAMIRKSPTENDNNFESWLFHATIKKQIINA